MFNNKTVKMIILATTLFALVSIFSIQVSALSQEAAQTQAPYTWSCSDLPNCAPYSMGCSGDVMSYSMCRFWCQTGTTVSANIYCWWVKSSGDEVN